MTRNAGPRVLVTLLLASRPVSWVNTAFPFAAVVLLTEGQLSPVFVVGTLFFLVPYNLLMYGVNDVFDYESDMRNPRKGGAHGGLADPVLHRTVLFSSLLLPIPFLVGLVWLVAVQAPQQLLVSVAMLMISLFVVVAYSAPGLRFKEIPGLDSVTSSLHFVTPALCGAAVAGTQLTPQLGVILVAFFLWGMAAHAFGAVQDIASDVEGGIASIATALGASATVRLSAGLWALAGVVMLFSGWPAALGAFVALPYILLAAPYLNVSDEDAHRATGGWRYFLVVNYVCGFFVTCVCIIFWVTNLT